MPSWTEASSVAAKSEARIGWRAPDRVDDRVLNEVHGGARPAFNHPGIWSPRWRCNPHRRDVRHGGQSPTAPFLGALDASQGPGAV